MRAALVALFVVGCGHSHPADAPDLAAPLDLGMPPAAAADLAVAADLASAGDGGSDDDGGAAAITGTATITGMMGGYSIDSARSVFAVVTGQSFEVYIADRAGLCPIVQKGSSPKDCTIFRFGATAGMAGHTFPAGTYSYPSGGGNGTGGGTGGGGMGGGGADGGTGMGTRDAVIMATGADCIFDGYNQATTGSFTLHAPVPPDAVAIDGTFDIEFDTAVLTGRFVGTFHAPVCPNATNVPETPVYCE